MSSEGQQTIRLAPPPEQWEYCVATIGVRGLLGTKVDVDQIGAYFNDRGAQGWEVVSVVPVQGGKGYTAELLAVMKRRL